MSENVKKVFRYDKIEKSIIDSVNKIAFGYSKSNPNHITDEVLLDDAAYSYACKVVVNKMSVLSKDIGYITEIIVADNFDYVPQKKNPYVLTGTSCDDRYARIMQSYYEGRQ